MRLMITAVCLMVLCENVLADQVTLWIGTTTPRGGESKGIYRATMDTDTGDLTRPVLAAEVDSPGFVTIHPGGKRLYSVCRLPDGQGGGVAVEPDRRLTRFRSDHLDVGELTRAQAHAECLHHGFLRREPNGVAFDGIAATLRVGLLSRGETPPLQARRSLERLPKPVEIDQIRTDPDHDRDRSRPSGIVPTPEAVRMSADPGPRSHRGGPGRRGRPVMRTRRCATGQPGPRPARSADRRPLSRPADRLGTWARSR